MVPYLVVKCSQPRTQETHKFGVPQIGDTQIRGFCSERLHAQETARHKRCFGSRGDAAHRGLLAAAGPWASRASPRRHPRAAGGGSASGEKAGTRYTSKTATSWGSTCRTAGTARTSRRCGASKKAKGAQLIAEVLNQAGADEERRGGEVALRMR